MKKILIIITMFFVLICLSGCMKKTKESVLGKIQRKVNNTNGYKIEAEMKMFNNDNLYKYDISVSYKKNDFYRVSLRNKTNNHEQIILKNNDGVYVLTPDLNKSFKFQSKWPYNSSQAYLLQSIIMDLKNDKDLKMKKDGNNYIFTSKVDYRNNSDLIKQKVIFDKNLNIKKVTVYDKDNNAQIIVVYKSTDMRARFKKNYFSLEENMDASTQKEDKENETTTTLEEAIYPMYLPEGTYLDTEKTVELEKSSRLILTFKGDSSFMLVEEPVIKQDEFEVVPTSGDLDILLDGVAIVSDTSVNWINDGIEYYLVSSDLSTSELLNVAKSISVMPVSK